MTVRCSLFGCEYGDSEIERDRDRRGSEVVMTVREFRTCEHCGDVRVISENTGVTAVTDEDADTDGTDAEASADAPATDGPTPAADDADAPPTAADGGPDTDDAGDPFDGRVDPETGFGAPGETVADAAGETATVDADADDEFAAEVGADATDGGGSDPREADGPVEESAEILDDDDGLADAIERAESTGETAGFAAEDAATSVEEAGTAVGAGEVGADTDVEEAVPDAGSDSHAGEAAADAAGDDAAGDEAPEDDAVILDDDDTETDDRAHGAWPDSGRAGDGTTDHGDWPDPVGEDDGWSADPGGAGAADVGVPGLTQAGDDGDSRSRTGGSTGRDSASRDSTGRASTGRTSATAADREERTDRDDRTGDGHSRWPAAGEETATAEGSRSDDRGGGGAVLAETASPALVCLDCGHELDGTGPQRAGDVCPDCGRGYLSDGTRNW
jgi:hypothetical protein